MTAIFPSLLMSLESKNCGRITAAGAVLFAQGQPPGTHFIG